MIFWAPFFESLTLETLFCAKNPKIENCLEQYPKIAYPCLQISIHDGFEDRGALFLVFEMESNILKPDSRALSSIPKLRNRNFEFWANSKFCEASKEASQFNLPLPILLLSQKFLGQGGYYFGVFAESKTGTQKVSPKCLR